MDPPLETVPEETPEVLGAGNGSEKNDESARKSANSSENGTGTRDLDLQNQNGGNGSNSGNLLLENPSGGSDNLNDTRMLDQYFKSDSQYFEFKSTSFADFICLLPTFSGTDEEFTIKDFIETVEEIANIQNWEDKHIILAIKLKLVGEAAIFAKLHPAIKRATRKEEIYRELKNRFGKIGDKNKILRLTQATQKPTENCRSFLSRLSGLAFKCFPTEDTVRERMLFNQALKGLNSNSRRFVMAQNPKNYQDIWEAVLQEEQCETYEKCQVEINVASSLDRESSDVAQLKALLQIERAENDKKFRDFTENMQKLVLENIKNNTPATSPPQTPFYQPPQHPYYPPMPFDRTQYPQYQPQDHFVNNNQRFPRNNIICHNCGKMGHVKKQCWARSKTQVSQQHRTNLN